jgi:hypothetical protein
MLVVDGFGGWADPDVVASDAGLLGFVVDVSGAAIFCWHWLATFCTAVVLLG